MRLRQRQIIMVLCLITTLILIAFFRGFNIFQANTSTPMLEVKSNIREFVSNFERRNLTKDIPGIYNIMEVIQNPFKTPVPSEMIATYKTLHRKVRKGGEERKEVVRWWAGIAQGNEAKCTEMRRLGTDGGGKWICVSALQKSTKVVYSGGSRNDFSFEGEVEAKFGFKVYTFDCTIFSMNLTRPRNVTFLPWCLGGKDEKRLIKGRLVQFFTLSTIMKRLGHDKVDLLKIDIEGSEHDILREVLTFKKERRPSQIMFELQLQPWFAGWMFEQTNPMDLSKLFGSSLYTLVNVEINYGCQNAEYSLVLSNLVT